MTDKILTSQDDAIARIIFNQPEKRNAVSLEMWEAVEGLLDQYASDDTVRILILSGAGGKAFVSGADISKFESERASADGVARYNATTARVYNKVADFPKPVIAQINGFFASVAVWLSLSAAISGFVVKALSSRSRPPAWPWIRLCRYFHASGACRSEFHKKSFSLRAVSRLKARASWGL